MTGETGLLAHRAAWVSPQVDDLGGCQRHGLKDGAERVMGACSHSFMRPESSFNGTRQCGRCGRRSGARVALTLRQTCNGSCNACNGNATKTRQNYGLSGGREGAEAKLADGRGEQAGHQGTTRRAP